MYFAQQAVAHVLWGTSQAGKSSFINILLDNDKSDAATESDRAKIGTGDGRSVTTTAKLFYLGPPLYTLADVGGYNDSELRFTGTEMAERLSLELASKSCAAVRFFVFESLGNDTVNLRNSVKELVQAFGQSVRQSIVVIASKSDIVHPKHLDARLTNIRRVMKDIHLMDDHLVLWRNEGFDQTHSYQKQFRALKHVVQQTRPVASNALEDLNSRIKKRAHELHKKQPTKYETVQYNVQEPYTVQQAYKDTVPYVTYEDYETVEPYTDRESYRENESYTTTETYQVPTVQKYYDEGRGCLDGCNGAEKVVATVGTAGVLGFMHMLQKTESSGWKERTVNETKTREVVRSKPVTRYRDVQKQRSVTKERATVQYRTVTRYRDKVEYKTVTRSKQVKLDPLPVEDFFLEARDQIVGETRKEFAAKEQQ